ncbi:MAG TPA: hypothetical protein VFA18_12565, partial [Gemmataceae bacterium]|nr:hypothetical protein [Gemmataceae bacterium]
MGFGADSPPRQRLRYAGLAIASLLVLAAVFFSVPTLAAHRGLSEGFLWLLACGMLAAYLYGYQALQQMPEELSQTRPFLLYALCFCVLA